MVNQEAAAKTGAWDDEEDRLLYLWQSKVGNKWSEVAKHIPGRTGQQCAQRWRHKVNPNIRRDKWSPEEDEQLITLVGEYGVGRWAEIARQCDGRTDQQCMGRWRRHLDPNIRREAWRPDEDELLRSLHAQYGTSWSSISKALEGRTSQQCRARWHQVATNCPRARAQDVACKASKHPHGASCPAPRPSSIRKKRTTANKGRRHHDYSGTSDESNDDEDDDRVTSDSEEINDDMDDGHAMESVPPPTQPKQRLTLKGAAPHSAPQHKQQQQYKQEQAAGARTAVRGSDQLENGAAARWRSRGRGRGSDSEREPVVDSDDDGSAMPLCRGTHQQQQQQHDSPPRSAPLRRQPSLNARLQGRLGSGNGSGSGSGSGPSNGPSGIPSVPRRRIQSNHSGQLLSPPSARRLLSPSRHERLLMSPSQPSNLSARTPPTRGAMGGAAAWQQRAAALEGLNDDEAAGAETLLEMATVFRRNSLAESFEPQPPSSLRRADFITGHTPKRSPSRRPASRMSDELSPSPFKRQRSHNGREAAGAPDIAAGGTAEGQTSFGDRLAAAAAEADAAVGGRRRSSGGADGSGAASDQDLDASDAGDAGDAGDDDEMSPEQAGVDVGMRGGGSFCTPQRARLTAAASSLARSGAAMAAAAGLMSPPAPRWRGEQALSAAETPSRSQQLMSMLMSPVFDRMAGCRTPPTMRTRTSGTEPTSATLAALQSPQPSTVAEPFWTPLTGLFNKSTQEATAPFGCASTNSPKLSSKAKARAAAQLFSPQPDPGSIERRLSFTDCNVRGATPPHKQLPLFKPAGESTPKASLPAPAAGDAAEEAEHMATACSNASRNQARPADATGHDQTIDSNSLPTATEPAAAAGAPKARPQRVVRRLDQHEAWAKCTAPTSAAAQQGAYGVDGAKAGADARAGGAAAKSASAPASPTGGRVRPAASALDFISPQKKLRLPRFTPAKPATVITDHAPDAGATGSAQGGRDQMGGSGQQQGSERLFERLGTGAASTPPPSSSNKRAAAAAAADAIAAAAGAAAAAGHASGSASGTAAGTASGGCGGSPSRSPMGAAWQSMMSGDRHRPSRFGPAGGRVAAVAPDASPIAAAAASRGGDEASDVATDCCMAPPCKREADVSQVSRLHVASAVKAEQHVQQGGQQQGGGQLARMAALRMAGPTNSLGLRGGAGLEAALQLLQQQTPKQEQLNSTSSNPSPATPATAQRANAVSAAQVAASGMPMAAGSPSEYVTPQQQLRQTAPVAPLHKDCLMAAAAAAGALCGDGVSCADAHNNAAGMGEYGVAQLMDDSPVQPMAAPAAGWQEDVVLAMLRGQHQQGSPVQAGSAAASSGGLLSPASHGCSSAAAGARHMQQHQQQWQQQKGQAYSSHAVWKQPANGRKQEQCDTQQQQQQQQQQGFPSIAYSTAMQLEGFDPQLLAQALPIHTSSPQPSTHAGPRPQFSLIGATPVSRAAAAQLQDALRLGGHGNGQLTLPGHMPYYASAASAPTPSAIQAACTPMQASQVSAATPMHLPQESFPTPATAAQHMGSMPFAAPNMTPQPFSMPQSFSMPPQSMAAVPQSMAPAFTTSMPSYSSATAAAAVAAASSTPIMALPISAAAGSCFMAPPSWPMQACAPQPPAQLSSPAPEPLSNKENDSTLAAKGLSAFAAGGASWAHTGRIIAMHIVPVTMRMGADGSMAGALGGFGSNGYGIGGSLGSGLVGEAGCQMPVPVAATPLVADGGVMSGGFEHCDSSQLRNRLHAIIDSA